LKGKNLSSREAEKAAASKEKRLKMMRTKPRRLMDRF